MNTALQHITGPRARTPPRRSRTSAWSTGGRSGSDPAETQSAGAGTCGCGGDGGGDGEGGADGGGC